MSKPKRGAAAEKAAPKFPLETLAANCRKLFGVSSCTFAGAAYGLRGRYTIAEMKVIIDDWKKKEVE